MQAGCSLRKIISIIEIVNNLTDNYFGEIPCYNTVKNWTLKCGLNTYDNIKLHLSGKPYAIVIDESMMIGSCKMLLLLAIPAEHLGRPINHGDVLVAGIKVAKVFNSEGVKECLAKVVERIGYTPKYVICDNDSKITKGVNLTGLKYHLDITHSLGMLLERTYKSESDFTEFTKQMSQAQFKYNMQKEAYLLPPKQRTIARFINLDNWVKWAERVLINYHNFTTKERQMLAFVPQYASFVNEMSEVMTCVRDIESECKHQGLSKETAKACISKVNKSLMGKTERMHALGDLFINYLTDQVKWLSEEDVHNNSSDIIESTFGIYKNLKSPNKLYGVTSYVLSLPVKGLFAKENSTSKVEVKEHLESIKIKNISKWQQENLLQNLVKERLRVLSA